MLKISKKFIRIGLPVITVLILAIAGQLWLMKKNSPPPAPDLVSGSSELADWQEYRNEKFNYLIKLPNNWVKDENSAEPAEVVFSIGKGEEKYARISIGAKETSQSFADLWNVQVSYPSYRYFGGKRAVLFPTKPGGDFIGRSYTFFNDLVFYDVETSFLDASTSEKLGIPDYRGVLNQVLSSFAFVE